MKFGNKQSYGSSAQMHMQTNRLCVWQMSFSESRCLVARSGTLLLHWLSGRWRERERDTHRDSLKPWIELSWYCTECSASSRLQTQSSAPEMLPLGLETVWKTEQKQVASAASFETLAALRQESFYPGSVFWNSSRWNLHYVINENNIKNGLLGEIRAAWWSGVW